MNIVGKCKNCLGCNRLEDYNFTGTDTCEYAPDWREICKRILKGEQTRIWKTGQEIKKVPLCN